MKVKLSYDLCFPRPAKTTHMITEWKAYLESVGAVIENDLVAHYGDPVQEISAAGHAITIADLSHSGLITAQGNDALSFLQGQLTNDAGKVDVRHSQLSGFCSPKGRLLAVFRVFFNNDRYYLQLPAEILQPILKRLGMYVLMSKVTLEDASDTIVHIGLAGPDSATLLEKSIGTPPHDIDHVKAINNITVIRIPGVHPRFELYGPLDEIKPLWEKLATEAISVGTAAWRHLDILAGIPVIYSGTMDSFVPQMVNLETLGGISFKKGCYTGQEVVARLHYRGNLKRRMYLAHIDSPIAPRAGDTLYSTEAGDSESAGTIVDAEAGPAGGFDVLAVIRLPYAESSEVRLSDREGPSLQILELPYQRALEVNNS
jgi:folate-binding protein YgfZ